MTAKALILAIVLSVSLSASQALALTPDELAKAQELGSQMNPPVDVAELLAEAEKYGVECDVSKKLRISVCREDIEIAKLEAEIEASKARTEALKAEGERIDQQTLEKVRDLQDFVNKEGKYKK
jgi:hypothetical protein